MLWGSEIRIANELQNRLLPLSSFEWAWWSVIYSLGVSLMAIAASTFFLVVLRFATGKSLSTDSEDDDEEAEPPEIIQLPFQKVNLTFKNMHYTVTSSVGNEKIKLLKGIDGIVEAGKMTALVSIVSLSLALRSQC
jgi:hypothetical protein